MSNKHVNCTHVPWATSAFLKCDEPEVYYCLKCGARYKPKGHDVLRARASFKIHLIQMRIEKRLESRKWLKERFKQRASNGHQPSRKGQQLDVSKKWKVSKRYIFS